MNRNHIVRILGLILLVNAGSTFCAQPGQGADQGHQFDAALPNDGPVGAVPVVAGVEHQSREQKQQVDQKQQVEHKQQVDQGRRKLQVPEGALLLKAHKETIVPAIAPTFDYLSFNTTLNAARAGVAYKAQHSIAGGECYPAKKFGERPATLNDVRAVLGEGEYAFVFYDDHSYDIVFSQADQKLLWSLSEEQISLIVELYNTHNLSLDAEKTRIFNELPVKIQKNLKQCWGVEPLCKVSQSKFETNLWKFSERALCAACIGIFSYYSSAKTLRMCDVQNTGLTVAIGVAAALGELCAKKSLFDYGYELFLAFRSTFD